jgi:hypothetical protein
MSLLKVCIATSGIGLMMHAIPFPALATPVIYALMAVVYVGILMVMREISKNDIKKFQVLIPKWVPYIGHEPKI